MKNFITILLLFCTLNILAQGEANFWFFGQGAGLNFNGGTPTPISGNLNTYEGCASFSDSNGDLLFYTDGTTVWDKTNTPMTNGTNLLGNPSSSQSAIIVPYPGNNTLFYIFTVGANDYDVDGNLIRHTDGLQCYTVDMTAQTGLGDVVSGPIDLSNGSNANWTEKITSVKGAECNTFWVISLVNNTFVSFKIDLTGLHPIPIISTVNYTETDPRGYLKVSPNGKKLASAAQGNRGNLLLYSFNDATGEVSNDGETLISNIAQDGEAYGVEFSPLSSKLYCATYNYYTNTNKLFQFDLGSPNITSSKTLIKSQIGFRGALQLAPNGKIYATVPPNYDNGTHYLDAINAPDELGINCNYELDAINLGTGYAMQGLPPFIASLLLPVEITDGITTQNLNNTTAKRCLGENYSLTPLNITGTSTYNWTFNNLPISASPSLTLNSLAYADAGIYKLEIINIDACGFRIVYKGEVELLVYTPPTILPIGPVLACDTDNDGSLTFDLNALKDPEVLHGQSPTIFEVVYFTNQADADANRNAIVNPYKNSSAFSTDVIIARIQNIQNPICYETERFTVRVLEKPNPPATISNLTTCDSNITGTAIDGFEIFDLTQKETEILNGQLTTDFTISYFKDIVLTSPIGNSTSFQNTTANLQLVYFKIINNDSPDCMVTSSFNLEVHKLPTINPVFTLKQCDEDENTDGFTNFNLNEANNYLTLKNNSLTVTYYLTSNHANLGISKINASLFSNVVQSDIFARIENQNGCYSVAQIKLLVSSTSFPANYLKTTTHCDNDAVIDGFSAFNLKENSAEIINQFPSGQNLWVSYYRNLADAQLEENEIPINQPYINETPFNQTLYVRVESNDNGECFGLGPYLNLIVESRPEFELNNNALYCRNLPPITVSTFNAKGNYSYTWKDENGTIISTNPFAVISKEGEYTVIATSNEGCESFPHIIKIAPSVIATIAQNDIAVIDDSENNSITVSTQNLGIGDYEFSLDDSFGNYQDEPYFENVIPGVHTLYIKDKNNCGIASIEVSAIGYPKFFTPNNDGYNDTWNVLGVNENFYQHETVYIFDRFGKLITEIGLYSEGWDGTFNGNFLPATDYWFSVELKDLKGNIRMKKGHFSLIRR